MAYLLHGHGILQPKSIGNWTMTWVNDRNMVILMVKDTDSHVRWGGILEVWLSIIDLSKSVKRKWRNNVIKILSVHIHDFLYMVMSLSYPCSFSQTFHSWSFHIKPHTWRCEIRKWKYVMLTYGKIFWWPVKINMAYQGKLCPFHL